MEQRGDAFSERTQRKAEEKPHFRTLVRFQQSGAAENDTDYVTRLASMPDAERRALLYGDWDSFTGQMHHRLAFDGEGVPMLYVFSTCRHFIRTLPALVYDQRDVEDVDTAGEDHIYDELRYVCMKKPISPAPREERQRRAYSPLDTDGPAQYGRYDFFRKY